MQPGFWRKCRVCLRWIRRAVLLVVVLLIVAGVWVDHVGLPDYFKRRIVDTLRARGVELEFSRMRLSLVRGIVAENVRIGHSTAPDSPSLSLSQIVLEFNMDAAIHGRLQLDGLSLRNGKFVLPVSSTNALVLDNIQTELHFLPNDTWSLDNFHAAFAGAQLALSGDVVHAPEIRNWDLFQRPKPGGSVARTQLRDFYDALSRIHFTVAPQLNLNFSGDARDIHSFNVRLDVNAPAVKSPWISARNMRFTAKLNVPNNVLARGDASWSWWTNLQPYRVVWTARLSQLQSEKLNADSVVCEGYWAAPELAVTNLSAELGNGWLKGRATLDVATREFAFTNVSRFDVHSIAALLTPKTRDRLAEFSWTEPPYLRAGGSLVLPAWTNRQPDWRGDVQPTIRFNGELAFTNGSMSGVAIDSAAGSFLYSNMVWQVPGLTVAQSNTLLAINGSEDDVTKDYRWRIHGTFDPEFLRPLLTASNAIRGLNLFKLTQPARLDADMRGRLYDYDSIIARGHVACTNFTVRGEPVDSVIGDIAYANRVLEFSNVRIGRGAQIMTADSVTLDFNQKLICFTNGYSTADPEPVEKIIGPKISKMMKPYHFLTPPTVLVHGRLPLRDIKTPEDADGADLSFDVVGGAPFQCLKLRASWITGTVRWMGQTLVLTNVAADLYGGSGSGIASFDFAVPHKGADYQFIASVTNINLHPLAVDISSPTNRLEGTLDGQIIVTHADTEDWRSPDGYGRAHLRDGLIWNIPIFGILSPVLNAIIPGLGNSRATDAHTRFTMTKGVIYSDQLEINTIMTRLDYRGTVDLQGRVNARVTALLLHNIPGFGPVISTIFYPFTKTVFEYKVTGTLAKPKTEPLLESYVPGFLQVPLHPIRSFEQLFPAGDLSTNAPPEK
jgi:hypothetical protein